MGGAATEGVARRGGTGTSDWRGDHVRSAQPCPAPPIVRPPFLRCVAPHPRAASARISARVAVDEPAGGAVTPRYTPAPGLAPRARTPRFPWRGCSLLPLQHHTSTAATGGRASPRVGAHFGIPAQVSAPRCWSLPDPGNAAPSRRVPGRETGGHAARDPPSGRGARGRTDGGAVMLSLQHPRRWYTPVVVCGV